MSHVLWAWSFALIVQVVSICVQIAFPRLLARWKVAAGQVPPQAAQRFHTRNILWGKVVRELGIYSLGSLALAWGATLVGGITAGLMAFGFVAWSIYRIGRTAWLVDLLRRGWS